jgi:hypothetical protein
MRKFWILIIKACVLFGDVSDRIDGWWNQSFHQAILKASLGSDAPTQHQPTVAVYGEPSPWQQDILINDGSFRPSLGLQQTHAYSATG